MIGRKEVLENETTKCSTEFKINHIPSDLIQDKLHCLHPAAISAVKVYDGVETGISFQVILTFNILYGVWVAFTGHLKPQKLKIFQIPCWHIGSILVQYIQKVFNCKICQTNDCNCMHWTYSKMFPSMYMFSQYVSDPEGLFSMGYMMHTLITAPPTQLQVT